MDKGVSFSPLLPCRIFCSSRSISFPDLVSLISFFITTKPYHHQTLSSSPPNLVVVTTTARVVTTVASSIEAKMKKIV
ncbi:unnamed protein product [Brassica oleracea var. botrytis]|uniref:Uncharacterized protein n=2 Tax=Brassica napus TaxID=3708 RepID=A0ABQ8BHH6_BRANA|nr:hypothetical protein HID58_043276 [Brassica napus]